MPFPATPGNNINIERIPITREEKARQLLHYMDNATNTKRFVDVSNFDENLANLGITIVKEVPPYQVGGEYYGFPVITDNYDAYRKVIDLLRLAGLDFTNRLNDFNESDIERVKETNLQRILDKQQIMNIGRGRNIGNLPNFERQVSTRITPMQVPIPTRGITIPRPTSPPRTVTNITIPPFNPTITIPQVNVTTPVSPRVPILTGKIETTVTIPPIPRLPMPTRK